VIQKALSISKDPYYSHFIKVIQPHLEKLKKMPYGVKLYNKLTSTYPELSDVRSGNLNNNLNNNVQNSKKGSNYMKNSSRIKK
jgi:hypothetical protein